jgi:hypothetical protein
MNILNFGSIYTAHHNTASDQLPTLNAKTPVNGNTDLQAAAGKEKQ